jgi:hypothetical protein
VAPRRMIASSWLKTCEQPDLYEYAVQGWNARSELAAFPSGCVPNLNACYSQDAGYSDFTIPKNLSLVRIKNKR